MAEAPAWKVGDEVLCHGRRADVRFVGATSFAPGTWVGVEFRSAAAGRHDGCVDGVRYFGPTQPNHGMLVRTDADSLKPYTPHEEAASKIQAQVRRKQDSEQAHYTQICRAFNEMECRAESDQLSHNQTCTRTVHVLQEAIRPSAKIPPALASTIDETAFGGQPSRSPSIVPSSMPVEGFLQDSLRSSSPFSMVEAPPPPLSEAASEVGTVLLTARAPPSPLLRFETLADGSARVPRQCIDEVMIHFKRPGSAPLSPGCIMRLINYGSIALRREVRSAVQDICTPELPGHLVVLGDTHGQLEDVLWVMFEHGPPSPENVYLFNGDVCDRGTGAVEILVLILLFKLWEPGCIFMNRGNHEDPCMNDSYGFRSECVDKFGKSQGREIFQAFNSLFQHLPLFTVIDSSIFVVHGGLWRKDFSLAQLRRVDFRRPLPEKPGLGLDVVIFDSVWSDPMTHKGIGSNSRGDSIVSFGEDVTKRFLKANSLRLLVRSHQVPDSGNGFEWFHNQKCLTVFSASNYCGDCGNLGGVVILQRGEEDVQIVEHWAPSLQELQDMEWEAAKAQARIGKQAVFLSKGRQKRREAMRRMEADIVRSVQEQIVKRKTELFEYWSAVDETPQGVFRISAAHWREGCAAIIEPSLPWVRLQEVMGVTDVSGQVHYVQFLNRYRVAFEASFGISAEGWEKAVWSKLMDTLLRSDLPLREALAALDATNDGLVSGVEFGRLLESCRVGITAFQARALLRSIASNSESSDASASAGRVSVWDMLGRLQVTLPVARTQEVDPQVEAWAVPLLRPLAAAVLDDAWKRLVPSPAEPSEWPASKLFAAWFEEADASGNGFLETSEFTVAIQRLGTSLRVAGCPSDPDSCARLASYCDVDGNGRINYFELLNALSWEDSLGPNLREDIMECVNAAIYFNMVAIRLALSSLDSEGEGIISPEDFVTALRSVSTALGPDGGGLTKTEIDTIAVHLPRNDDGRIDYEKFLRSFHIVDSHMMAGGLGVTVPITE